MLPVYLDYNATTPVDARVLEAMLPYFSVKFGNAASKTHSFGWVAEDAIELARAQAASLLNATPHEIIFTSGATESLNIALKGVYEAYQSKGNHIIVLSTEHKAVLDVCRYLETKGASISYLPVDRQGLVDLTGLIKEIRRDTILISAIFANNETGTIQPVKAIGEIARRHNVLFLCDATQAAGKVMIDVNADNIDVLAISAHKIYGPKGTGAIYIRRKNPRVSLIPMIHGGGHERGLRSGTLNVPGIVGLGKACEIAQQEMWDDSARISALRTFLEQEMCL
jgi:cysteine desulfurase